MTTEIHHKSLSFFDNINFNDSSFDTDRLERKILAERLTASLLRLGDGAVICLDAPWGEGKTFFAKNWLKMLDEKI